jgi:hypothetical protein
LQLGIIVTNQVEKMPHGVQWSMIQLPNYRDNYIFIYFGMPLKMNDISVLFIFIFIQINISHKSKSHMHLQTTLYLFMQFQVILTSCHGKQSHLQSQKWLLWTRVANAWVGMDMIPCSEIEQLDCYI